MLQEKEKSTFLYFRLGNNSVIQSAAQVHQWALWKGEVCPVVFFWLETLMSLEHFTVLHIKHKDSGVNEHENYSFVLLQNGENNLILWLSWDLFIWLKPLYGFCRDIFGKSLKKHQTYRLWTTVYFKTSKHFIHSREELQNTLPSFYYYAGSLDSLFAIATPWSFCRFKTFTSWPFT